MRGADCCFASCSCRHIDCLNKETLKSSLKYGIKQVDLGKKLSEIHTWLFCKVHFKKKEPSEDRSSMELVYNTEGTNPSRVNKEGNWPSSLSSAR